MENKSKSTASFSEDEKPEYSDENEVYKENEIPQTLDSTSQISEYINEDNTKWESVRDREIDFPNQYPVSALDVAAYILKRLGQMTTMKLQKLIYYCQAWSLVWDEKHLFKENIEAWAYGPVVRELFNYHRGQFSISTVLTGNPDLLDNQQKETIEAVLDYYGNKSSQWLSDLTHMEDPWKLTRLRTPEFERGNRIISHELLAEYYGSIPPNEE